MDLGVVYSGTLGLEMLIKNIPVITTGKSSYNGLGFTAEPKTEKEYIEFLFW